VIALVMATSSDDDLDGHVRTCVVSPWVTCKDHEKRRKKRKDVANQSAETSVKALQHTPYRLQAAILAHLPDHDAAETQFGGETRLGPNRLDAVECDDGTG
jgi:hypothetical protein